MDRRVMLLFITVGSTVGGYLPTFLGFGQLSLVSILGGVVGGIAGVWAFRKMDASY